MMSEAEQFALCDAYEGNTMITFSDKVIAMRYAAHRQALGHSGVIALVDDTRTRTGLCVMWRDPVKAGEIEVRLADCRWQLEKTLAGEFPVPVPGEVNKLSLPPIKTGDRDA